MHNFSNINETVKNNLNTGYKTEVRMDAFSNDAHARFNVRDFTITNLTGAWTLDSCV